MSLSLTHFGYQPAGYGRIAYIMLVIAANVVHGIHVVGIIIMAVLIVVAILADILEDGTTLPSQAQTVHNLMVELQM